MKKRAKLTRNKQQNRTFVAFHLFTFEMLYSNQYTDYIYEWHANPEQSIVYCILYISNNIEISKTNKEISTNNNIVAYVINTYNFAVCVCCCCCWIVYSHIHIIISHSYTRYKYLLIFYYKIILVLFLFLFLCSRKKFELNKISIKNGKLKEKVFNSKGTENKVQLHIQYSISSQLTSSFSIIIFVLKTIVKVCILLYDIENNSEKIKEKERIKHFPSRCIHLKWELDFFCCSCFIYTHSVTHTFDGAHDDSGDKFHYILNSHKLLLFSPFLLLSAFQIHERDRKKSSFLLRTLSD